MNKYILLLFAFFSFNRLFAQPPKLYVHIVSHNEPTDNLNQPLNYAKAKSNVLQLANIVDSKNVKWNLQTSDGFVFGARDDQKNTGTNIFKTLAASPYDDNIEIDPRSKNFTGRNIADQWYLLDSLGANPTKTVGGFIYYVCPPKSSSLIDWWQYTDTITGLHYGNKIKFDLLSGAGSLDPHCNDLNDFGIFKPDTTTNFYQHNPDRNVWCIGVGCAPVLDSLDDEQAIIKMIKGQVDSIQSGLWPSNKFYVTRIMTNQREYGPLFFQKIARVIDSLNLVPNTQLQWATIEETFADFQVSGLDHSQWLCGETMTEVEENNTLTSFQLYPNPTQENVSISFREATQHKIEIYNSIGVLVRWSTTANKKEVINLSGLSSGIYLIEINGKPAGKIIKK